MAKRAPGNVEAALREFEEHAPTPSVPRNPGNYPDDQEPPAAAASGDPADSDTSSESPAPLPASEPEPASEPAGEPDSAAEPEEETDVQALRREVEFLRLQAQTVAAPPPAPPAEDLVGQIKALVGNYRLNPEEWAAAQSDPQKAEAFFQQQLMIAAAAGMALAGQQTQQTLSTRETQAAQNRAIEQAFYGTHPGLADWSDLTELTAREVSQQYPQATLQQKMDETARRTSLKLRARGVEIGHAKPARAAAGAGARLRPVRAEMHGARGGVRATLSPLEKQLRDFEVGVAGARG